MTRAIIAIAVLAALIPTFFALIADADPQHVMQAQMGVGLFLAIVAIVLVTSLITGAYLFVFGKVAQRVSRHYLPLFIGWKFLRSQRTTPTLRSRMALRRHRLGGRPLAYKLTLLGLGFGLLLVSVSLHHEGLWNRFADGVSPAFATSLEIALQLLGGAMFLGGLAALVIPPREKGPKPRYRLRSAVTLPTFISIVGVSIGLWALIVVLGVMHGLQSDLREKILRTNAHVIIEPAEAEAGLPDAFALEAAVRAVPEVVEAHAIARGDVMMTNPNKGASAFGVAIKGLSDEALADAIQLRGQIVSGRADFLLRPELLIWDQGRYPLTTSRRSEAKKRLVFEEDLNPSRDGDEPAFRTANDPPDVYPGIILGAELAATLGAEIGETIQLISPDGDVGPTGLRPRAAPFRVAALFRTGMFEYDKRLAYLTVDAAQRFLNLGPERNALEAHVREPEDARVVARVLGETLGPDYAISTFQERNANLFAALMLERLIMLIILGFIIFVASLLIVISLVMFVIEKMREVAILKALGARNGQVVGGFVTIGGIIATFGILIGIPLGIGTCYGLIASGLSLPPEFYIRTLPVKLDPFDITIFGLAALGICLLATVYPSLRAARLQPAEGIRHG